MKKLILLAMVLGLLIISATQINAAEYKTPLGIKVHFAPTTEKQYAENWGLSWANIDFNRIDDFFTALQKTYGSHFNPKILNIVIQPWSPACSKKSSLCSYCVSTEKRFLDAIDCPSYCCVQGLYDYSVNTIEIHLGDDSGQGSKAWCATALDYELGHVFLRNLKDKCWYYEFEGTCPSHYLSASDVGLCQ